MHPTAIRIALTLGDPCGIGPELWVRILCERLQLAEATEQPDLGTQGATLCLYGDPGVLSRAADRLNLRPAWQRVCASPCLTQVAVSSLSADEAVPGEPSAAASAAQVRYLEAAIAAAVEGQVQALCTAPIHKAGAKAGGLAFPGHTELLGAHLRTAPREVMMLAGPSLRVALATTHLALRDVAGALTVPDLANTLATTARALHRDFAIAKPRLWVAGLNPHAGEGGHFGDEEIRIIAPAISVARTLLAELPQVCIEGPLPPDSLFRAATTGPLAQRPDAVVAMYHDQGLIPLKLLDFDSAVNVTLGLSVIRTSPDHGVAYDIAGRGLANPSSQAAALDLCLVLARRRAGTHSGPRSAG